MVIRTADALTQMPVLILDHPETPRGLVLGERALIGRRPFNTIVVADPAVSRIHAWIGRRDGRAVLYDAGSRSGTFVNDQPISGEAELVHNDSIAIGPARLVYLEDEKLPEGITPFDEPPPQPVTDPYDGGIYFDCTCGGPMWVNARLAGAAGKCRYCGQRIVVPHMSGQTARPIEPEGSMYVAPEVAAATKARAKPPEGPLPTCSICQTDIHPGEERTQCPSCHLMFHAQCWQENYGCSAYGCDQVNVLAPKTEASETVAAVQDSEVIAHRSSFPIESVLLAFSFVAMALGALAYGLPSAAVLLVLLVMLFRKPARKGMIVAGIVISLVGIAAGYVTSMFWWKGVRLWETLL
jgi:hypothetical protein